MEMNLLVIAVEDFRIKVGNLQYPPDSTDNPEAVKRSWQRLSPDITAVCRTSTKASIQHRRWSSGLAV